MLRRHPVRGSVLWAATALWSGLSVPALHAQCQFKNTASASAVTYRFSSDESTSGRRLLVTMSFRVDAGAPTTVKVPSDLIDDLHIVTTGAAVKRDSASGETMVSTLKSGIVTLAYTLRNGWSGPLVHPHEFQPVILPQYVEVTGDKALVWRKQDREAQITANFDWQGLPPTWAVATSFGVAYPAGTQGLGRIGSTPKDRC